ncbi:MAG TPA: hypothetical protein PKC18_18840, partial [Lacipirellulaceae bacterium]|nr:hypothetical protein [Lacipirellulaceae bacterium]
TDRGSRIIARQLPLPLVDERETQAERCRRILARLGGLPVATADVYFTDENYRRATERARADRGAPIIDANHGN